MNYIHDFKPKPVDKKLGQQEKELKKELLLAEQERLKAETEALKVRKEKEITYNQKELAEQQKQMAQSQKLLAEKERKLAIEAEEKREIKRVKEDLEKELAKLDDKNPLYVVDGIVVNKVKDLNPDQIQKISIVKGAKAIDTYGPEGLDGVVVIVTKSKIRDKSKKKSKSSKSDKE